MQDKSLQNPKLTVNVSNDLNLEFACGPSRPKLTA